MQEQFKSGLSQPTNLQINNQQALHQQMFSNRQQQSQAYTQQQEQQQQQMQRMLARELKQNGGPPPVQRTAYGEQLANNIGSNIVERSQRWQENKQKKTEAMVLQKALKEQHNEDLTFKPNLQRPRVKQTSQNPMANTGLDKYMERVNRAKQLKKDKQDLESKVFKTGKNWENKVTQPNAPKLTAKKQSFMEEGYNYDELNPSVMTGDKNNNPRVGPARNAPISSLKKAYNINKVQNSYISQGQSFQNNPNEMMDDNQNLQNQTPSNNIDFYKTSNPQSQNQLLQKENPILNVQLKNDNSGMNINGDKIDGVLRVAPNLTYEEAQRVIHQHIIDMKFQ